MKKWQAIVVHVCSQLVVGGMLMYAVYRNRGSKFDLSDLFVYLFSVAGYIVLSIILVVKLPQAYRTGIRASSFICFGLWLFAPAYYPFMADKLDGLRYKRQQEQFIQEAKAHNLKTLHALGVKDYRWNDDTEQVEVRSASGNVFTFRSDTRIGELRAYCRFKAPSPCDTLYSLGLVREAVDLFMQPDAKATLDSLLKEFAYDYTCDPSSNHLYINVPLQAGQVPTQVQAGLVQDSSKLFYCIMKDPSLRE